MIDLIINILGYALLGALSIAGLFWLYLIFMIVFGVIKEYWLDGIEWVLVILFLYWLAQSDLFYSS